MPAPPFWMAWNPSPRRRDPAITMPSHGMSDTMPFRITTSLADPATPSVEPEQLPPPDAEQRIEKPPRSIVLPAEAETTSCAIATGASRAAIASTPHPQPSRTTTAGNWRFDTASRERFFIIIPRRCRPVGPLAAPRGRSAELNLYSSRGRAFSPDKNDQETIRVSKDGRTWGGEQPKAASAEGSDYAPIETSDGYPTARGLK